MILIRDDEGERRVRIEQMIEEVQRMRESAARQMEHARQALENSDITLSRLKAVLKDLELRRLR